MNKRLVLTVGFALFFVSVASLVFSWQSPKSSPIELENSSDSDKELAQAFNWKKILNTMPRYQKPIKSTPKEISKTDAVSAKISDAVLLAIVSDHPKQAIMITPNTPEPKTFSINEGWLDNWVISVIRPDSILWSDETSGETYQQYLYN